MSQKSAEGINYPDVAEWILEYNKKGESRLNRAVRTLILAIDNRNQQNAELRDLLDRMIKLRDEIGIGPLACSQIVDLLTEYEKLTTNGKD